MDQISYTKMFLSVANLPIDDKSIKEHRALWWWNQRSGKSQSLRLNNAGLDFVVSNDIRVYEIDLPAGFPTTAQVLIWLDKHLDSPYFLAPKKIVVLTEVAAFELHMLSGDLKQFGYTRSIADRFNQ